MIAILGSLDFRGEAVAIDLGERGVLFSILRSNGPNGMGEPGGLAGDSYLFSDNVRWANKESPNGPDDHRLAVSPADPESFKEARNRMLATRPLLDVPAVVMPILVRFKDIKDPRTVEIVDPTDLAESFGDGVKLIRTTVQITDDPVTIGITKFLPDFKTQQFHDWRIHLPYGDQRYTSVHDFTTGGMR